MRTLWISESTLGGLVDEGQTTVSPPTRLTDTSALYMTFQVARGVQSLIAVVGNLLTVVSVLRYKAMRTGTNYLVASLALADLVSGINFFIFLPLIFIGDPHLWRTLCLLNQSVALVAALANVVHMAAIAGDRYIAVRAALSYSKVVTPKRAGICVGIIWLVVLCGFGPLVGLSHEVTGLEDVCTYIQIIPHELLIVTALPCVLLNSLLTLILYVLIAVALRKQSRRMSLSAEVADEAFPQRLVPRRRSDVEKKVTKAMGLVGLVFVTFSLPGLVFASVAPVAPADFRKHGYRVVIFLWYCSSFTNPIIYAWMNQRFYAAFRALLQCRCSPAAVGKMSGSAPAGNV